MKIVMNKDYILFKNINPLYHFTGRMPNLAELVLANNQLGNKPDIDWRWLFGPQVG